MPIPNTADFITGFQATGHTSITAAQVDLLVNGATPASDRGLVVVTTDSAGVPQPPNATTTPLFANYIWLRLCPLTRAAILHIWNPLANYNMPYSNTSGNTMATFWNPSTGAAVAANSITNAQLAGSITADKLAGGITTSQLVDGNTFLALSTTPTVATQISGSFVTGFIINNAVITGAKIAPTTIEASNIKAGAVTLAKMDTTGAIYTCLYNAAANTPSWGAVPSIARPGSGVNSTTINKIPYVLAAGAGDTGTWSMRDLPTAGCILQYRFFNLLDADETGVPGPTMYKTSATLKIDNFVPVSPTSTIVVKLDGLIYNTTGTSYIDTQLKIDKTSGQANAFVVYASSDDSGLSNSNPHVWTPTLEYKWSNQTIRCDVIFTFRCQSSQVPTLKKNAYIEITEYVA